VQVIQHAFPLLPGIYNLPFFLKKVYFEWGELIYRGIIDSERQANVYTQEGKKKLLTKIFIAICS
jgi:hypothetical protein